MFLPNVVKLHQFYASPLGEMVRRLVGRSIGKFWPDVKSDAMLAVGFSIPYLDPYAGRAAPLVIAMPASQGAIYWPPEKENSVFLAHESRLPIQENSFNRVLLIHAVEHSEELSGMMQEVWRVLVPGGRVLMVVPNRLSLWSRSERSPLGYGRPFTAVQARSLLADHHFTYTRSCTAIFAPPLHWKWLWKISDKLEIFGKIFFPPFGGVLLVEAEKQLYAAIKQPVMAKTGYRIAAANPAMSFKPGVSRRT